MHIGIFGATGVIGGRVAAEAVGRGHRVTAYSRRAGADRVLLDVLDPQAVGAALSGVDVVVCAINSGDDVASSISGAGVLPAAAASLLSALETSPATRLIFVGGAGSLEVAPGLELADTPGFAEQLAAGLDVPTEYTEVVEAHREALRVCRQSNRNWTYVSPSAGRIPRGERTGRYRVGRNNLLVGPDGPSINADDLAVAILDEVEVPRHIGLRFTVGY